MKYDLTRIDYYGKGCRNVYILKGDPHFPDVSFDEIRVCSVPTEEQAYKYGHVRCGALDDEAYCQTCCLPSYSYLRKRATIKIMSFARKTVRKAVPCPQ